MRSTSTSEKFSIGSRDYLCGFLLVIFNKGIIIIIIIIIIIFAPKTYVPLKVIKILTKQ